MSNLNVIDDSGEGGGTHESLKTKTILTSTENASFIITDFLATIYKMDSHVLLLYVEVGRCLKMTLI